VDRPSGEAVTEVMSRGLLAVALLALVAGTAEARQPASCKLVRDASGDPRMYGTGTPVPATTSVDILSADIATSDKRAAVVFRVAGLREPLRVPGADAAMSRAYWFTFPSEGGTWMFTAHLDGASPPHAIDGLVGLGSLGIYDWVPADVTVDLARNEVRVTALLKKVNLLGKLPHTLGPFEVQAARQGTVAVVSVGAVDDQAHGDAPYRLGSPSCVRV
jgi:hypothetical protein